MGPGSYRVRGKPHPAGILELNFKAQIKVFQPWSWSAINKNNGFLPRRLGSGSGEPPKSEIPPNFSWPFWGSRPGADTC